MSQKEHCPSVASDVESVATDGESVTTDVESFATNVKSIATDVESIATDVESDEIHQTSLFGGFICSNSFSIYCNINNSVPYVDFDSWHKICFNFVGEEEKTQSDDEAPMSHPRKIGITEDIEVHEI
ncbi:hypothetical protein T459_26732 [Capsicum annuum]|uniref:Uncharacterized protein n=1 Tax=Capsicum annuum TaxID=4072 RepID=A0A2G2YBV7_CAPAN|nr:hypothetical protein T459_26732 [Capsicum annuum]